MAENLPDRIDRAALERIIKRATELQTSEREIGEGLTGDEVLALGKEVGIPARYLQQALYEERSRITTVPAGIWDNAFGAGRLTAQRVVTGTPESVGDILVQYLDRQELLCVQRRQPNRISWEPLTGFQAAVRRSSAAFGGTRMPFLLSKVTTVTATLTPLEDGYTHVMLEADVRKYRGAYIGGSAAAAGTGIAATGVLLALGAFTAVALAPIPIAAIVAYGVARQYSPRLERIQLGLERALDHAEQADPGTNHELPPRSANRQLPPKGGLIGTILDEVRRGFGPPMR